MKWVNVRVVNKAVELIDICVSTGLHSAVPHG
jgi:hypothetical protein